MCNINEKVPVHEPRQSKTAQKIDKMIQYSLENPETIRTLQKPDLTILWGCKRVPARLRKAAFEQILAISSIDELVTLETKTRKKTDKTKIRDKIKGTIGFENGKILYNLRHYSKDFEELSITIMFNSAKKHFESYSHCLTKPIDPDGEYAKNLKECQQQFLFIKSCNPSFLDEEQKTTMTNYLEALDVKFPRN
jgi:hypothetical protein